MSKFLKVAAALTVLATPAMAEPFGLGRTALPEEIAAWNLDVSPDGTGLPPGSGDVLTGEVVFADKCASCHGDFAEGVGNWPKLAGGWDTLDRKDPVKTVGSYWPHLSTAWDYINRSMPFGNAQSLEPDEVYAIVAYILYSNDLVDDEFVLSDADFAAFELPNADGFIVDNRIETEFSQWVGEPCMTDCKDNVEVTMRAMVLDVTPDAAKAETGVAEEAEVNAVAETEEMIPEPDVPGIDPELVAAGEKIFRKCSACHQVGEGAKNRSGPILNGVFGHAAGGVDGFKYSKPLIAQADEGLVWTDETLAAFLAAPRKYIKGTKMGFAGLKKQTDVDAIIAYLKTFQDM